MPGTKHERLKLKNQLCFPLYAASREVIKRYKPYLDRLGLTYTQYLVMLVLWELGQINVKALGEKLFLDSGTLTPVLKSLEAKGYVRRSRSTADERVLLVAPTAEGDALADAAAEVPEQLMACIRMDSDDAAQLYGLLYRLLGALQETE